ncbi:MAG: hypothetical protein BWY19_00314 [bacterium ADurb.Bin212]|nr:MAG: hypothetical protein BWY19_00314 [bacterium ADurb.Bin212]
MPPESDQIKEGLSPALAKSFLLYSELHKFEGEEENDSAITSAVWYEKLRAAVEYQETHLMFKNAVARIIRRSLLISVKIKKEKIYNDLVNELIWANYITPKTIDESKSKKVNYILDKYLTIIRRANSINKSNSEIIRYFSGICACEIEEEIFDKRAENQYLDFVFLAIKDNYKNNIKHINDQDHIVQLKLAIYTNIFKPDVSYLSYWSLKLTHTNWLVIDIDDCKNLTKSIDPFMASFERHLSHPLRSRYLILVRNMVSPFSVIRTHLLLNNVSKKWAEDNPILLENNLCQSYESLRMQSNAKIWRGIWRALIFLLMTKTVLAFIIEIPVDRAIHGNILWLPLIANITFPPFLMFLSGITIPKIPQKNSKLMKEAFFEIINTGRLTNEKALVIEKKKRTKTFNFFNYLLAIFSLLVLILVVFFLLRLKFNVVSIVLFFLFVSAVSFLSFRIRVNSKELLIKRKSQDSITTLVEFIFLPFISLGKAMSDSLNRLNPFLLAVDFIIEAPFKTILKILRAWFNFISLKKEEMEY